MKNIGYVAGFLVLVACILIDAGEGRAREVDIQLPSAIFQGTKPLCAGKTIFYIGQNVALWAVDFQGNEKSLSGTLEGERFSRLTADDENIYVVGESGGRLILYGVGRENGDFWQVDLPGYADGVVNAAVVHDGMVSVLVGDRRFITVSRAEKMIVGEKQTDFYRVVGQGGCQEQVGMLVGWKTIRLVFADGQEGEGTQPPSPPGGMKIQPPQGLQLVH